MGPLDGFSILEIAGIGPGPFAAMVLADMGAEVLRIDRAGAVKSNITGAVSKDIMNRGRRSVAIDIKQQRFHRVTIGGVEQIEPIAGNAVLP